MQIRAFVFDNALGLQNQKLKYERKNENDSARSSKMMPSCKWPICAGSAYFISAEGRGGGGALIQALPINNIQGTD